MKYQHFRCFFPCIPFLACPLPWIDIIILNSITRIEYRYMMMRDAASTFHDFISSCVFYICVWFDRVFQSEADETEVDVHSCTCVVDLSHSHWYKRCFFNSLVFAFVNNSFAYVLTEERHALPLNGSFKRLSDEPVIRREIS